MFYLILGQAHSRGYTEEAFYNKLCRNRDTKIKMPKMKVDEETDIIVFSKEETDILDRYFRGTNAETAYMLGKHCGIRVNECYGLKWDKIDFEEGTIVIDRQMQYQDGLIKLASLKTRNAKRKIYMSEVLKDYLYQLWKRREDISDELYEQRAQNQMIIMDINGKMISSLELVNCFENGKIQTVNSMKYHAKKITETYNIHFKYHYLRHTYGTTLANANVPLHVLCSQMGHGNSNVTQKYYLGQSEAGIEAERAIKFTVKLNIKTNYSEYIAKLEFFCYNKYNLIICPIDFWIDYIDFEFYRFSYFLG